MITSDKPNLGYIDFHCHLDLYSNYIEQIRECERLAIRTLAVTNAPCVWPQNKKITENCKFVRPALGLHPQLAHEREDEIVLFEKFLHETRYVGEVGLDGAYDFKDTLSSQRKVFQKILKLCASHGGKILSVHSRKAAKEVVGLIEKHLPSGKGCAVLHWFTGTKKEAQCAADVGCYFSVNNKMFGSDKSIKLLESLPDDRVITESDGPFIRISNRLASPKDVSVTVKKLARLWAIDEVKVVQRIQTNLKRMLS